MMVMAGDHSIKLSTKAVFTVLISPFCCVALVHKVDIVAGVIFI